MAKNLKLLLIENVDDLGIVGDVVNVRTGFARNYLLPRNLATQPDEKLVKQLAGKRAEAEKLMAKRRGDREALNETLKAVEIEMVRACNDMGILYGAVTQQDIASALGAKGHKVAPRDVRITSAIKRCDNFDVHIKLDSDLDAVVKLHVKPDRELAKEAQGGEVVSAAPASIGGGGDDRDRDRGPRRRDALSQAIESANQQTVTGWAKKEAAPGEAAAAPEGKKGKKDGAKEGKKEASGDEGESKAEKKEKSEKAPKGEKKPAKDKPAKK